MMMGADSWPAHASQPLIWLHLDAKGALPAMSYLKAALQWLHTQTQTQKPSQSPSENRPSSSWGLIVEFEDQLPISELIFSTTSAPDWAQLLPWVHRELGWPLMALIQTAGHCEFILKHGRFRSFRELDSFAQCLDCSGTRSEVYEFLAQYASQVVDYVQETVGVPLWALHLGGDEVWHLGQGRASQLACQKRAVQPVDLYLDHLERLERSIHDRYPQLRLLFWDDMLRGVSLDKLLPRQAGLSRLEPVVWQYTPQLSLDQDLWAKYDRLFTRIWAASAFKGATSSCAKLPLLQHHIENHLSWRNVIQRGLISSDKFQGLISTGWARFDHFSALCELFPASLPSLVCCHRAFSKGRFEAEDLAEISASIGLPPGISLMTHTLPNLPRLDLKPSFPGGDLFALMNEFVVLEHEIKMFLASDTLETWFSPFHEIQPHRVSTLHVTSLSHQCSELKSRLEAWCKNFERESRVILHDPDIQEWKVAFVENKLTRLTDLGQKMTHCLNIVK